MAGTAASDQSVSTSNVDVPASPTFVLEHIFTPRTPSLHPSTSGTTPAFETQSTSFELQSTSASQFATQLAPPLPVPGLTPTLTPSPSPAPLPAPSSTNPHTPLSSFSIAPSDPFSSSATSTPSSPPSPSSLITISPPTGTPPSPLPPTGNSKNTHLLPLIGVLVGGSVFLAPILILAFIKCRRRRTGRALDHAQHGRITWPGPAVFRRPANIQNLVADPIPSSVSNPTPPESKRGRLERTRLELEEAQRLRDAFQLDLDSRSSSNGLDDNSPDGGPDTAEFVAMRAQIQQMSVMIAALQAAFQQQAEDSQPPAYSTTIGP